MALLVLIAITLLSCVLFEYAGVRETLKKLLAAYKEQFALLSDREMGDAQKQRALMALVGRQLRLILRLILGIALFVSPFLSLYLFERVLPRVHPGILLTWWGLLVPVLVVAAYLLLKRTYGRIFRNR